MPVCYTYVCNQIMHHRNSAKKEEVIDVISGAYNDIEAVMENQHDLLEVVYTLKQIVCVKG